MNDYYNISLEQSVLSSFLFDPIKFEDTRMSIDDFYLASHQNIFRAMKVLYENDKPIDEEFIKALLVKDNCFDEQVLTEIMIKNPISNLTEYENQLLELSHQRKLIKLAIDLKSSDLSLHQKLEVINKSQEELELPTHYEPKKLSDAIVEYDSMPTKPKYETGVSVIDNYFNGGLELSQLIMLGGVKGSGKTAFSLQFLFNVSQGFKTAFFSYEMPIWKIAQRSKKANLSQEQKDNLVLLDKGRDIADIQRNIKYLAKGGVKFFVIDSLMKLTNKHHTGKRHEQIADITNKLSKLCMELDIIIILIVQISNESISNNKMTVKGSGDADYDADIMFFIQRDKDDEVKRYFICEKNRQNGNEFKQEVYFNSKELKLQQYKPSIYEREYTTSIKDEPKISMEVL